MNPPDTAPKDATMILADFGWPWLVPAIWNPTDGKWTVAMMQKSHDGPDYDVWFETDQERDIDLKGWILYPKAQPAAMGTEHRPMP